MGQQGALFPRRPPIHYSLCLVVGFALRGPTRFTTRGATLANTTGKARNPMRVR